MPQDAAAPPRAAEPARAEAPRADPLMLDNQLCFAVYSASHAFARAYRPRLEALGLTYPQYLAMLVLWERDGVSVKAIGERLGLDSGTLTPLLKRLEAAGLVARARDTADERQVLVSLTAAGRELRGPAAGLPQFMARTLGLSVADMKRLKAELEGLTLALDATVAEEDA